MASAVDASKEMQLDLILQQIDALPTLSSIAVRVLELTGQDDVRIREVVDLIESDPALSAKILSLCRRADRATSSTVTTVDRAVVLLGLDAVRAAMLSIEVFELLDVKEREAAAGATAAGESKSSEAPHGGTFSRAELWRHCIAVACASELIAERLNKAGRGLQTGEAFLAGLLHDLGKLALDRVLPKSFRRVAALCEDRQGNVAEFERRVIGLDHHVAGKRLAEHWGLPHMLQDVMWLHGQSPVTVPELAHRDLIGVITIADALVRSLHIGWSGNFHLVNDIQGLCEQWNYDAKLAQGLESELYERVQRRTGTLGLRDTTSQALLLTSLSKANFQLGRIATVLGDRSRTSADQQRAIESLTRLFSKAETRRSLPGSLGAVVRCAGELYGPGMYAFLWHNRATGTWILYHFSPEGRLLSDRTLSPPPEDVAALNLAESENVGLALGPLLAWLERELKEDLRDPRSLWLLPLTIAQGPSVVLLHDRRDLAQARSSASVEALRLSWASVIAAAAQHAGARRLGERVADANRQLSEMQATLVESQSFARLGRLMAGAAHEMNNPLTVISGQAQMLLCAESSERIEHASRTIIEASEKLGKLIEALHILSSPQPAQRAPEAVREVVDRSITAALRQHGKSPVNVSHRIPDDLVALIDAGQIGAAVTEVILNALQANPRSIVEVVAHPDPVDDRLLVTVRDDGKGMSRSTLEHAFDPFFSNLEAGRRTGLGLARARRLVELHGGSISLRSTEGSGSEVEIAIPGWRVESGRANRAA